MPDRDDPRNAPPEEPEPDGVELDGFDPERDPVADVFDRVEEGLAVERAAGALADAVRERGAEAVAGVASGLNARSEDVRIASARALASLAEERPDAVAEAVAELTEATVAGGSIVRNYTLLALAGVADETPEAVRPAAEACGDLLPAESPHVRARAVRVLGAVAADAPADALPFLPELVDVATDVRDDDGEGPSAAAIARRSGQSRAPTGSGGGDGGVPEEFATRMHRSRETSTEDRTRHALIRGEAAQAVADASAADPSALDPHLEALFDAVEDDPLVDPRSAFLAALVPVAEDDPAAVAAGAARIAPALGEGDYPELQRRAARVLALSADADAVAVAGAVESRLGDLRAMLRADDPAVRAAAVGLLAYVAERRPRAVAEAVGEELLDCATDDYDPVRAGAVWGLRYLRDELGEAEATLRWVAREDPNEEIRQIAADALGPADG
jgi:hypothetical protein